MSNLLGDELHGRSREVVPFSPNASPTTHSGARVIAPSDSNDDPEAAGDPE